MSLISPLAQRHPSAPQHPQGSQLTHPMRSKALTFCSGPTREAYFLASYLLCCFMQISTKGLEKEGMEEEDKAEPSCLLL